MDLSVVKRKANPMEQAIRRPDGAEVKAVALKAFAAICEQWQLPLREAAALADMSESTWKRARRPGFAGDLTRDQMLRLSDVTASICRWSVTVTRTTFCPS